MVPQLSEVYLRADCPVSSLFADFVFFFFWPSPENPSDLGKEVSGPVGSPPNFQAVSDTYFSEKKGNEKILIPPFFFLLVIMYLFFSPFFFFDGSVDHRGILHISQ